MPEDGEALIRVLLAGICNTDIELYKGYMDFEGVPGHEFVGVVEEAKDNRLAGERVVGEINCGCGVCERCRVGDPRHCPDRTVLGISGRNGSFAEYLTLPEENLLILPDSVSNEEAVIVEPLAAAMQIYSQVEIKKGMSTLVLGDGKLGILMAIALSARDAEVSLLGRHFERNTEMLPGVRHINSPDQLKSTNEVFNLIVEATGNKDGLRTALEFIEPQGTIILKSTVADEICFDASVIVVNEISIIGSRCGRFEPAVEMLSSGRIETLAGYIEKTYPLTEGLEAFEHTRQCGALKVLINPSL